MYTLGKNSTMYILSQRSWGLTPTTVGGLGVEERGKEGRGRGGRIEGKGMEKESIRINRCEKANLPSKSIHGAGEIGLWVKNENLSLVARNHIK